MTNRDHQFDHFGALCRFVRENHGVPVRTIAEQAACSEALIRRFEGAGRGIGTDVFSDYVTALSDRTLVPPPFSPLTPRQADILRALDDFRRKSQREQERYYCDFGHLDFSLAQQENGALEPFLSQLSQLKQPAHLTDSLWQIYALNRGLMTLFDVQPNDELLARWEGWHSVGIKLIQGSKVGQAHLDPDSFFARTEAALYQDEECLRYLFSPQLRHIVNRLAHVASSNTEGRYRFEEIWGNVVALRDGLAEVNPYTGVARRIIYRGRVLCVRPRVLLRREVVLETGARATFSITAWEAEDSVTKAIFEELFAPSDSQDLFFAADYAKNHGFAHVNDWPEVREELLSMECM